MRRSKHITAAERLIRRIQNGDFYVRGIPSERELAEEIGVSRMTARKVVKKLLDDGHLSRLPNGRLQIRNGNSRPQIALLASAYPSTETEGWNISLSKLSREFGFLLRPVYYYHNDDPVIKSTIEHFDCTFFLPSCPPENLAPELKKTGKPFFILNSDWSSSDVPSILLFPPFFVNKLLDHLSSLGHRRIDCLNVQPGSDVISDRIGQWKSWIDEHGFKGRLFNEPVKEYSDPYPAAYGIIDRLIRRGKFDTKALLCISEPAALAAMCAMIDHGIRPGRDVAVCVAGTGMHPESFRPSLTSLKGVDPVPFLVTCIKWIMKKKSKWTGPLLLQPDNIEVSVHQSTVPEILNKSKLKIK
ncbi:MAG TPA: hypothetical protein DCZ94_12720 [Lentisphaeria bacterium]|nr:MAG: hypothetical protein A2X48_09840 [Lentisphaerae bacterium GWF2_49_21]HBC87810.1 hypothetical protein [Lentisphaeria bacterium]